MIGGVNRASADVSDLAFPVRKVTRLAFPRAESASRRDEKVDFRRHAFKFNSDLWSRPTRAP